MAIKNFNERKNYYKSIYGDYQIIINNISLETAEKVLNEDAMDGEIFIQLLSQKGNTINRMIWTSKNFFDFGKNQLLAGKTIFNTILSGNLQKTFEILLQISYNTHTACGVSA